MGQDYVLDRFAQPRAPVDAPVTLTIRIEGRALRGLNQACGRRRWLGVAVQLLGAAMDEAAEQRRVVELLGLDRPAGAAQLGLGVANLFFSGLTAGFSFLAGGSGGIRAGKAWDDCPPGKTARWPVPPGRSRLCQSRPR